MTSQPQYNIQDMNPPEQLGNGAQFWAYVKPETTMLIAFWVIIIEQKDGPWYDVITSDDPYYRPQTLNLSGIFNVTVIACGLNMKAKKLLPQPYSKPDIGCNVNCAAMIGIVANDDGTDAQYWTVWDAVCHK